jgi:hypothetical protein
MDQDDRSDQLARQYAERGYPALLAGKLADAWAAQIERRQRVSTASVRMLGAV